jgi:hypothetical protein
LWPQYDAVSAASSLLRIFLRITNKMYQVISIRTKNTWYMYLFWDQRQM